MRAVLPRVADFSLARNLSLEELFPRSGALRWAGDPFASLVDLRHASIEPFERGLDVGTLRDRVGAQSNRLGRDPVV